VAAHARRSTTVEINGGFVRTLVAFSTLALVLSTQASATTYYFSGTLVSGNAATQSTIPGQVAIPNGTPFTGSLTIDTSITSPSGGGDGQHRNYPFAAGNPPAELEFHVGNGLYDALVTSVGNEVDAGYTVNFGVGVHDAIWFWSNGGQVVGGSGQAANPLFFDIETTILLWISTPDGPLTTANAFDVNDLIDIGSWEFAGLSLFVMQGGANPELYRGAFTSFSDVPEPDAAGQALGAAAALWLAASRRGWRASSQRRARSGYRVRVTRS
jgi:hypothetical protein